MNWGREEFERTDAFKNQVATIKQEVRAAYSDALSSEKNVFKKIWLRTKIMIEIKKRIQFVSSSRNLHILNN